MLAFRNRFHGHNSLRYVYRNGRAERSQYLTIKTVSNPRRNTPRIAVVVSKKVLKSAVGRNRIRRRLYEQFRLLLPHLDPRSDIVCIVTSNQLLEMPDVELRALVADILIRSGLCKSPV